MKRVLLLAAVLGIAVAGSPLAALNKYIAFGDSITAGSSWPSGCGICPVIFDCTTPGCEGDTDSTQAERDKCGHAGRLTTWLGAGNYVRNAGKGAEQTAAAASRFSLTEMPTQCPDSPGDCIAVILMHGTNDMSGSVSPETARDNLGFMIDEAKSRNIDTLLMSIIRRGLDPNHVKTKDYRDLTLALATTKNLESVDPWLPLCPDTPCYNLNYWLAGETQCTGGDPDPGHLDPDGYDVLTDLIKAEFPGAAPVAPVPTSPTGDITDTTPDFVWPEVATARWYELEVDATTTWWEAAVHCSLGACTANPGVALAEGVHSWRVRGRNLRGMGAWSASTAFEICIPAPKDLADFLTSGAVGTTVVEHCGPITAAAMEDFEIEATGDLTVQPDDTFTAYDGFSVLGELTVILP